MISLSNLLKQCYVINSGEGMRIINSNAKINERLQEIGTGAPVPENEKIELPGDSREYEFSEGMEIQKIDIEAMKSEAMEVARAEAEEITARARAEAETILEEAREQVKDLFEEQKQLGFQEGVAEKESEFAARRATLEEEMDTRRKELSEAYQSRMECLEADIVDAVALAFEKVFQIQFSDKREILLALVTNTLMDVDLGDKIRIRVNDEDRMMLGEHLDELREQVGADVAIEFMHDNKLADGQCQIETPYGVFDCGVDTQLTNLIKDIRSLV